MFKQVGLKTLEVEKNLHAAPLVITKNLAAISSTTTSDVDFGKKIFSSKGGESTTFVGETNLTLFRTNSNGVVAIPLLDGSSQVVERQAGSNRSDGESLPEESTNGGRCGEEKDSRLLQQNSASSFGGCVTPRSNNRRIKLAARGRISGAQSEIETLPVIHEAADNGIGSKGAKRGSSDPLTGRKSN